MPVLLRCVLFAVAVLQSWSGAALSMADGLSRSRDSALPAHVEDQNASHGSRGHSHDCIACRELRTAHALPAARNAGPAAGGSTVLGAHVPDMPLVLTAHECCARSPPAEIG